MTTWLHGISHPAVIDSIPKRMPAGIISASYILIEHEAPAGVDVTGFANTFALKGYITIQEFLPNTLKVYIDGVQVFDFIETGSTSFTVTGNYIGYLTVSYLPALLTDLHGNIDTYNDLKLTTRARLRYINITIQVIEQMRYAMNTLETAGSIEQTRWCGGFNSDEFALSTYDVDLDSYRSNLRLYTTEITPQMVYELIDATTIAGLKLGIAIDDDYDNTQISSRFGIPYDSIEHIRRNINTMESVLAI